MSQTPLRSAFASIAALFLAHALSSAAIAQQPAEPIAARMDAIVHRLGVRDEGPGLAVLVIQQGRVVVKKGYGLADLKTRTPISASTTFELASASKPFAAMAVMILHDRGKLAFDDPARKYVPEVPAHDARHPIRIVHLLQHTSGLPDYTELDDPGIPARGYVTNAAYAREMAAHRDTFKPAFPPGARHDYSNTNYMLLALIVERVSGKSYGTFLREEIFGPLRMERAWVYESPEAAAQRPGRDTAPAVGYTRRRNGTYRPTWGAPPERREHMLTTGDGAVWCSLDDLARWDRGLREGRLVKPATWRLALTPSKTADGKTNHYGFGWQLEINDGALTGFWHDGSWSGFETTFYRSLADNRTIVLLGNHAEIDVDRFWKAITRLFE